MSETVGVDFVYSFDGNDIGGKDDATATFSRDVGELAPTSASGTQFRQRLVGLKDVQIDFDSLWLTNSSALNGFSPTVTVNPSQSNPPELKYVSEITLTINLDLVEFANDQHSEYLARGGSVLDMEAEIAMDVDASDFYSTGTASRLLVDAWDSTDGKEDVQIALPGGNTSFESTWVVEEFPIATPAEDATENTFTLSSSGSITETINGNLDAGLDALITTLFSSDPTSATVKATTSTSGNIEFSGPALPSSLEITIPVEGSEEGVQASGTLEAAGAFTIQETP